MLPFAAFAAGAGSIAAYNVLRAVNTANEQATILNQVSKILNAPSKICLMTLKITTLSVYQYRSIFALPASQLEDIKNAMLKEMQIGLEGKEGGLFMLPSFVDILPSGCVCCFIHPSNYHTSTTHHHQYN